MPATTDTHFEEKLTERGCKNGEESQNTAASSTKNIGFFCDERGYLDQIEHILQHGKRKGDRTGTGVISVFGSQARYSLRGSLHHSIMKYGVFLGFTWQAAGQIPQELLFSLKIVFAIDVKCL